ncbi:hypothetical protein M0811_10762 [Anaeramoeba ignava]|uniref:Ubiquitin-like domain-containing protein n=1 Tax=Anaeramoeba ignava TaxID=1746090 RepID=A0A9Q0R827_ANAIG|nr:hypothetical protein M0811_10762 [Anaeramoeba ignava]
METNIKVKTIKGQTFDFSLPNTATILEVKKKIEEKWNYEPDGQKIIYKGRLLTDNVQVHELNLGAKDFFVVTYKKYEYI